MQYLPVSVSERAAGGTSDGTSGGGYRPARSGRRGWTLGRAVLAVAVGVGCLWLVLSRGGAGQGAGAARGNGVACAAGPGQDPRAVFPTSSARLEFLAIGDWGLDSSAGNDDGPRGDWDVGAMSDLAAALKRTLAADDGDFVLNVGDSFYQYGCKSADDVRWKTTFEDVYGSTQRPVWWYSLLGNHDYKGNLLEPVHAADQGIAAQIDRTFHPDNRQWCMPGTNFTVRVALEHVDVAIVVFDSQALVREDPGPETTAYDGALVPNRAAHLAWLESALCAEAVASGRRARPHVLLTASHHFIATVGSYFEQNPPTVERVMYGQVYPILRRCGVRAHFHGHDHLSQLLNLDGMLQVGVGSAGKRNGAIRADQSALQARFSNDGFTVVGATGEAAFARVRVDANTLDVAFMSAQASPLFRVSLPIA